ncbi:glycosyltransferase family 4 protein [Acidiphilium sp. PA]|uniref:glycosyltransferase family 4 protein n=1 Tax=Acidiphilium sp. PA TaxID=2871705 RepID=UPI0022432410|nr:glycosyltransferase family 4 protein [Acidiphilium sp. PA]MCW8308615.1 glycosyltransferase family 4 protein [Acidiphilium sp. PA]
MSRHKDVKDCFLVCPVSVVGGGMGQVVSYLMHGSSVDMPLRLVAIDARGPGSVLWSPYYMCVAIGRIVIAAACGRLGLVHVHVAERASLVRKGLVALAARMMGVPVLLHLHAAEIKPFYDRLPGWGRWLARGVFHRADLCVVLGIGWRDWLIGTIGVASDRVVVVRNGVPIVAASPLGDRLGPFRILFLGNLTPRKGVGDLLVALASPVLAETAFEAVFAGGGEVETYRRQAADLGLSDRVTFTGWVDRTQAATLTAAAHVLVLPSYHEGLPLVILEALGAGTPVICTPVGSIPEVLEDETTALFVSPGDSAEMAHALRRLIDDAALRAQLTDAGRNLYSREFTMDAFVKRIAALYRELITVET